MNIKKIRKIIYVVVLVAACIYILYTPNGAVADTTTEVSSLELPKINSDDIILKYKAFTVSYNSEALIPEWVAYELTAEETDGGTERSSSFRMDKNYAGRQAMREDYSNSGYDKGHMAPAADMKWDEEAMKESFLLTNICPQVHELNSRDWLTVEKMARECAKKYGRIWVVCGPIIGKHKQGTIGENKVVVPDAFFKAFLVKVGSDYQSIAFIMQNNATHHKTQYYVKTVNEVEAQTGLDFFPLLDDSVEENVEENVTFAIWGI